MYIYVYTYVYSIYIIYIKVVAILTNKHHWGPSTSPEVPLVPVKLSGFEVRVKPRMRI